MRDLTKVEAAVSRRSEQFVLLISGVLWAGYVATLLIAYPKVLSLVDESHLALVNGVFPYLNLVALCLALLCLACAVWNINNYYIHIILLIQLCMTLWLPVHFLSSYIEGHDIIFHGAVSLYAPQALSGQRSFYAYYLYDYPVSFVFYWIIMNLTGLNLASFGNFVFPIVGASLFAILIYSLGIQLFDKRIGFLATALTITGLYYVEYDVEPQWLGVILILTSVLLLLHPSKKSKIFSLVPSIILIGTHPESPLVLAAFLVSVPICALVMRRRVFGDFPYLAYVILLMAAWIGWAFFKALGSGGVPIAQALYSIVTFSLEAKISPSKTLLPLINQLKSYSLYGYTAMTLMLVLTRIDFGYVYRLRKVFTRWLATLGTTRVYLIICATLILMVSFALRNSAGGADIVQRALFYYYICASLLIASVFIGLMDRKKNRSATLLFILIGCWLGGTAFAYPVASYYAHAYDNVSYSQVLGLEFLGNNAKLNGMRIFTYRPNDLALVTRVPTISLPWPGDQTEPGLKAFLANSVDFAVVQHDQYFYYTDQDLSLTNNTYTRMNYALTHSSSMNKVYSSPGCNVFVSVGYNATNG